MSDARRFNSIYKSIIGDTKATIEAIQRYLNESTPQNMTGTFEIEEAPAESINRVLNSTVCEETNSEIQKIIKEL